MPDTVGDPLKRGERLQNDPGGGPAASVRRGGGHSDPCERKRGGGVAWSESTVKKHP